MAKLIDIPTSDAIAEINTRWSKRDAWIRNNRTPGAEEGDQTGSGPADGIFHVVSRREPDWTTLYVSSPEASNIEAVDDAAVADAVEEARTDIATLTAAVGLLPELVSVAHEILRRYDEVVIDEDEGEQFAHAYLNEFGNAVDLLRPLLARLKK